MSSEERATSTFLPSFDRDLENARVLIEDSPWKESPQKYRKVAETILRRILTFDPGNARARALLAKAEAPLSNLEALAPKIQLPVLKADAPVFETGGSVMKAMPVKPTEEVFTPKAVTEMPFAKAETPMESTKPLMLMGETPIHSLPVDEPSPVTTLPAEMGESAIPEAESPTPMAEVFVQMAESHVRTVEPDPLPIEQSEPVPEATKFESPAFSFGAVTPATEAPPAWRPVLSPDLRPATAADVPFVVAGTGPQFEKQPSRKPPRFLISFAVVGAIAGLAFLAAYRKTPPYTPKPAINPPKIVQASNAVIPGASTVPAVAQAASGLPQPVVPPQAAIPPQPPTPLQAVVPPQQVAAQQPASLSVRPDPVASKAAAPTPAPVVAKSNSTPVAATETGTLAVGSPTTVDIYVNDQLVGSAPTTLVLPAGNQTIEYRHQDMRKTLTHVIKANETTTAMITFDVVVQINARPWAQVFVDGTRRQPLGQTPLSDVRVPIGSNLIFQNPNFPEKSYRITGRETQVRVTFP